MREAPSPRPFDSAETLAHRVDGHWVVPPAATWQFERLLRVRFALSSRSPKRQSLIPVPDPDQALPTLQRSTLDSNECALLVQEDVDTSATRFPLLRVRSVKQSLMELSAHGRSRFDGKVIAITGSVGKSTIRSMLTTVLSNHHKTYTSTSPRNGLTAIQEHCLHLRDETYAVVEVARIGLPEGAMLLRPDVAIVSSISEAHMKDYDSLEHTARVKAQIFDGLNDGGVAVINVDSPHAEVLLGHARAWAARTITYGTREDADIRLLTYNASANVVTVEALGRHLRYQMGHTGAHNALNSLAVVGTLEALGEDPCRYTEQFARIAPVKGRGDTLRLTLGGKRITVVDHSYNANPMSMRAALDDFGTQFADARRVLVLGDMLELGPAEGTLHAELVDAVLRVQPARVYLLGELMASLWHRLPPNIRGAHVTSTNQLRAVLTADLQQEDAVLFKASRSTGLAKMVRSLRAAVATEPESWHLSIHGETVHGVGYRRWLRRQARAAGVTGWVRNRGDESVEAILHGPPDALNSVIARARSGPRRARVSRIVAEHTDSEASENFTIRPTLCT